MFKRTKQLIKANTLLKEESENLKREYEKKEQEAAEFSHMLSEMSMGYLVYLVIPDEMGALADLIIEYANDGVLENGRLNKKEIIGESVKDVLPTFADNLLSVCTEAVASGNRTSFIAYEEVEDRYLKFICYEESVNRCACVISDITNSFLSERLLEEEEERYRSVIDVSEEFVFELDLEGRFCYISEGIRKLLGYEPEEYLGRYYYEQYPVDVRKNAAHTFQKCYNECGQEIHGLMTELIAKDGRHHYALQNGIVLMDEDGRDIGYRGIYIDVTSLEKTRRKAERERMTRTDFVAKLSHEIHSPVNGLIGLTSLALEEPRTYKVYGYLQKIEESAKSLLAIVNTMLEYSDLSGDEIKLYEQAFSLQLVIKKVTNLLEIKAQQKKIKLIVELEEQVPDTYSGDSLRLGQILMNLLSCAIQYTMEGYVKLIVRKRDKGLLFIIKDSAAGKDQYSTSVGMLVSKQLIEVMGGRVKVVSKENEGAKVYVALPLIQCKQDLVRSAEARTQRRNVIAQYHGTVLAVESASADQTILCNLLERFGVKTVATKEVEDIPRLMKEDTYDMVFLEVNSTDASAFETCVKLRNEKNKVPVIAVGIYPFEMIKESYERSGMTEYVKKPWNLYKMEELLKKYLPIEEESLIACTKETQEETPFVYPFIHIDYAEATSHIDHEYELYNRIVFSFIQEYEGKENRFHELSMKNAREARRYIHTMQGAAQEIGAYELAALAGQLEEMLVQDKREEELIGLYTAELKAVLKELTSYADSITMESYQKGYVEEEASGLITRLETLLFGHSAEAVDEVEAIYKVLYREDIAPKTDMLVNQIEQYEFALAERTLLTIRESLGVKE